MKDAQKPRKMMKLRLHYFLTLIHIFHLGFYLIYWFSIGNLRNDVDQFIADLTGLQIPYTTILIVLTAMIAVWSLVRFIRLRLSFRRAGWTPGNANWVYFGVSTLFLVLFYLSFMLIIRENPSQKGVIYQLLNLTRVAADPLLFLIIALWLRRSLHFLRKNANQKERRWPWVLGIIFELVLLIGIWLVPTIFPPNWAYQGDLPAKPALIAHRGASMLAPENTLAAEELAGKYEAFGFETDVQISMEGVPFLMHDQTLKRTTNIAEVFPDRIEDIASSFTIDELKALNAGLWFIQKDPYDTIKSGLVSQAQLSINQGQRIPTLDEALEVVDEEDLIIIFDLRYPPEAHPYHDRFFDIVFGQCKESDLDESIWFLISRENLDRLQTEAPQMTRVVGISSTNLLEPTELLDLGYEIVNADAGILPKDIQAYRQEGLGVNIYTIDQPWLFSQIWLSGVTSVTTNNVHSLTNIDQPVLNVPYSRYLLYWGLFGFIVAIWLASVQPEMEIDRKEPVKMKTPDLLDFAMIDEGSLREKLVEEDDKDINLSFPSDSKIDDREGAVDNKQED